MKLSTMISEKVTLKLPGCTHILISNCTTHALLSFHGTVGSQTVLFIFLFNTVQSLYSPRCSFGLAETSALMGASQGSAHMIKLSSMVREIEALELSGCTRIRILTCTTQPLLSFLSTVRKCYSCLYFNFYDITMSECAIEFYVMHCVKNKITSHKNNSSFRLHCEKCKTMESFMAS